jgi:hypothetical protein
MRGALKSKANGDEMVPAETFAPSTFSGARTEGATLNATSALERR